MFTKRRWIILLTIITLLIIGGILAFIFVSRDGFVEYQSKQAYFAFHYPASWGQTSETIKDYTSKGITLGEDTIDGKIFTIKFSDVDIVIESRTENLKPVDKTRYQEGVSLEDFYKDSATSAATLPREIDTKNNQGIYLLDVADMQGERLDAIAALNLKENNEFNSIWVRSKIDNLITGDIDLLDLMEDFDLGKLKKESKSGIKDFEKFLKSFRRIK